jgi:serine/threonine protein phosphatase 1
MLTYAVGDIHGSYDKLVNLVSQCNGRHAILGGDAPRFVFLGDYVDRGPGSRQVVEFLMTMQANAPEHVVCLRGNHEELLIAASKRRNELTWLRNGGDATLVSYGVDDAEAIPAEHLAWFKNLPLALSDGPRFYVHAGIEAGVPLDQQDKDIMLWIREPFLSDMRDHGKYIVHGHTPLERGQPDLRPNRLNLDTGACFGGPLTAGIFDEVDVGPIAFMTHDGNLMPARPIELPDQA